MQGFRSVAALVGGVLLGCSSVAPPRAQLVVYIDTTAPLPSQLAEDSSLSADAAIDSVRIDVLSELGTPLETFEVAAPDARDWPISFGAVAADGASELRLRLRGFQARHARRVDGAGDAPLEPLREVTIDRLVTLELPENAFQGALVMLEGDCLGRPARFGSAPLTCQDAAHLAEDPRQGVALIDATQRPATRAGTWLDAHEVPCRGAAHPGAICIPGGLSVLGDVVADDPVEDGRARTAPLRPVVLSPFWMDATEFTVGDYRAYAPGLKLAAPPVQAKPNGPLCTFAGDADATHDDLPLNCVRWATAQAPCEAKGGSLSSEARWEHAARGRGQRRIFPWGDTDPSCCVASLSRQNPQSKFPNECPGSGAEPVGSHPKSPDCPGGGDVSRDGVLDLGGSISELTLDSFAGYDQDCWRFAGVARDPQCAVAGSNTHVSRGGQWVEGFGFATVALRYSNPPVETFEGLGLRCVYEDTP